MTLISFLLSVLIYTFFLPPQNLEIHVLYKFNMTSNLEFHVFYKTNMTSNLDFHVSNHYKSNRTSNI